VSHRSVTREIYFVRGQGQVYNIQKKTYEERNIVVADTIGLCDTEWDDDKVISLIKNRISSNINYIDAVFIIFKADRLIKQYIENIQKILKWLGYYKNKNSQMRFWFIGTYADHLSDGNKNSLLEEATEIFQLEKTGRVLIPTGEKFQSLVYTGFPPEDDLNEKTKEKVKESWKSLLRMIKHPGNTDRIYVGQQSSCTILWVKIITISDYYLFALYVFSIVPLIIESWMPKFLHLVQFCYSALNGLTETEWDYVSEDEGEKTKKMKRKSVSKLAIKVVK